MIFRRINPKTPTSFLMEGGDRVLAAYPPDLSEKAEKLVTRLGVQVMKGVMATLHRQHRRHLQTRRCNRKARRENCHLVGRCHDQQRSAEN